MDLSVCDSPKCYTNDKGAIMCPVKSVAVCQSYFFLKNNEESFFFVIVLFYKSSLRNLE